MRATSTCASTWIPTPYESRLKMLFEKPRRLFMETSRKLARQLAPGIAALMFGVAVALVGWPQSSFAQSIGAPGDLAGRELIVGTKEAPPFAMKAPDGTWQGISIDLWRRIADEKKWRYRFVDGLRKPSAANSMAKLS